MDQIINLCILSAQRVRLIVEKLKCSTILSSEVTENRFKMQSVTLQACTCKGGGDQRIKCHWQHVARASLDIEKDIIRLKKCLHRETKGEPRHSTSGLPNTNFRVIAADNRCTGKLCLGEVMNSRQGKSGSNRC